MGIIQILGIEFLGNIVYF